MRPSSSCSPRLRLPPPAAHPLRGCYPRGDNGTCSVACARAPPTLRARFAAAAAASDSDLPDGLHLANSKKYPLGLMNLSVSNLGKSSNDFRGIHATSTARCRGRDGRTTNFKTRQKAGAPRREGRRWRRRRRATTTGGRESWPTERRRGDGR